MPIRKLSCRAHRQFWVDLIYKSAFQASSEEERAEHEVHDNEVLEDRLHDNEVGVDRGGEARCLSGPQAQQDGTHITLN